MRNGNRSSGVVRAGTIFSVEAAGASAVVIGSSWPTYDLTEASTFLSPFHHDLPGPIRCAEP